MTETVTAAENEPKSPKGASDGALHMFLQSRWDEKKVLMAVAGAVVLFVLICFGVGAGVFS
jgi:hypothetical protein